MIVIVSEVEFVLHSIVQSISDHLSDYIFGHNFDALVSFYIKGVLAAHAGSIMVLLIFKQVPNPLGVLNHCVLVWLMGAYI